MFQKRIIIIETIIIETTIDKVHVLNQYPFEIWYPAFSAFERAKTQAVEPTQRPFPPSHTQKIRAHQSRSTLSIPWIFKYEIIGIIAIVIGILSRIEEKKALTHKTIRAVITIFCWTPLTISHARKSKTHAFSIHQTRTKRAIKKRRTESSKCSNIGSGSSFGWTISRRSAAKNKAKKAIGKPMKGWRKNDKMRSQRIISVFLSLFLCCKLFSSFIERSDFIFFEWPYSAISL